jgi:hypothetical protein
LIERAASSTTAWIAAGGSDRPGVVAQLGSTSTQVGVRYLHTATNWNLPSAFFDVQSQAFCRVSFGRSHRISTRHGFKIRTIDTVVNYYSFTGLITALENEP